VKGVTVTLTEAEARALLHAVGNSIYGGNDRDVFVKAPARNACWRAHDKISDALKRKDKRG
jgi:hypothetical protein